MTNPVPQAIVIGASAGAIETLTALLPQLSSNYPLPIMIVVHIPPDKISVLADLFQARCAMRVVEAEDKTPIEAGCIYFAPPDYHLLVEKEKYLSLSTEEPVLFSRPSIDVLFETAADAYGETLIGIILTGANSDGADGLKLVAAAGGTTIVQTPSTARAATMPTMALKACPDAFVLSLEEIAAFLKKLS